jgi:DNA transposition AAA+ family ATPase
MPRRAISTKQKAEIKALIVKTLKTGISIKDAYGYAGISKATYYDWIAKDTDFTDQIEYSQAQVAARYCSIIMAASDKDWRAAAWWLERKRPDDFGTKTRNILQGDASHPLKVEQKIDHTLTDTQLERVLQNLYEAGAFSDTEANE